MGEARGRDAMERVMDGVAPDKAERLNAQGAAAARE